MPVLEEAPCGLKAAPGIATTGTLKAPVCAFAPLVVVNELRVAVAGVTASAHSTPTVVTSMPATAPTATNLRLNALRRHPAIHHSPSSGSTGAPERRRPRPDPWDKYALYMPGCLRTRADPRS